MKTILILALILAGCAEQPIRGTVDAARNGTYYSPPHRQVSYLEAAWMGLCHSWDGDWSNGAGGSCTAAPPRATQ